MKEDPDLRRLLWYLLGATRGGRMRARVLHQIRVHPGNINQLSQRLTVDYRLVDHHMEVLKKNALVVSTGERYGRMYSLSPWLEAHIETFDEVCLKLKFDMEPESDSGQTAG